MNLREIIAGVILGEQEPREEVATKEGPAETQIQVASGGAGLSLEQVLLKLHHQLQQLEGDDYAALAQRVLDGTWEEHRRSQGVDEGQIRLEKRILMDCAAYSGYSPTFEAMRQQAEADKFARERRVQMTMGLMVAKGVVRRRR